MFTYLILLSLFLLALVAVGFLGMRALTAERGPEGRRLGCAGGCGLAALLGCLGCGGLLVFALALLAGTVGGLLDDNPIRNVWIGSDPGWQVEDGERRRPAVEPRLDPRRPLHVVFELEGHESSAVDFRRLLERFTDEDVAVHTTRTWDEDGLPISVVDVALPASGRDLREIEEAVRTVLPDLDWARGLFVELKSVHRDL